MMRRMKRLAFIAGLTTMVLGGPAVGKVNVVQSPSAALTHGSTFAWSPISGVSLGRADPAIANEITADRLDTAVETALASKGYRQVRSPAQARLLVSYRVIMAPGREIRLSGGGCGLRFCNPGSLDTKNYTDGTLVLDLVERETGRLVYRASSEKRLNSKDVSQEKLNKLVLGMTKSLPM